MVIVDDVSNNFEAIALGTAVQHGHFMHLLTASIYDPIITIVQNT
jgi:hypothetical protein